MRTFHKMSLLTISVLFAAAHAAPALGWQQIRNALAAATNVIKLDVRQASNETAPSQPTGNITTPTGNITTSTGNITITPCTTAEPGNTCDEIASILGISISDFLAANPSVDAACDDLLAGVVYCA